MQISNRLAAVAAMVTSGSKAADIGTDHAYIPIWLVKNQKIPCAIAMDVNRGPLQKAVENIRAYRLEEKIETRLSDGLAALKPGEAESIIIAGMGGPLTVRILKDEKEKLAGCRELILQPQSDIVQVRSYIEENGWAIAEENMILEDGKYYPMMRVIPENGRQFLYGDVSEIFSAAFEDLQDSGKMTEEELRFGPCLLKEKHPVLEAFIRKEQVICRRILDSLRGQNGEQAVKRVKEVQMELELLTRTLESYFKK